MIALLVSFTIGITTSLACDFAKNVNSVYSLSGPVTLVLKDLGLLKNKKLKGVSIFHPVSKKDFNGVFLPGGVFLSRETIKGFAGSLLFFDESRELSRMLAQFEGIQAVEIKTRTLTPPEVMQKMERELAPHLVGCSFAALSTKLNSRLGELKKLAAKDATFLFFLGKIENNRLPELIMVQDGVVKWMIQQGVLKTYPSELPYVNWSAKILNSLPQNTIQVGLKDPGSVLEKEMSRSKGGNVINLTYPGALIPGSGQVEAMIYLYQNL